MSEEELKLIESCGPHCGVKDGMIRHCKGCHRWISHGNAKRHMKQWWPR